MIEPVIRVRRTREFTAWPVASLPPEVDLLPLSSRLTLPEVGTAMAAIAMASRAAREPGTPADQILRNLIGARLLIAPGGLRVHDTSKGLDIEPSCCSGLECWREWHEVANGGGVWLGHDPTPWVEHCESTIRVWPDDSPARPSGDMCAIEIELASLPGLVGAAELEMKVFLERVRSWTSALHHVDTDQLADALDRSLHITG